MHEHPRAVLHRLPWRHRRPGRWFTFDARHNHPRIGRIVIARGRDAADVAISTAFGPAQLTRFNVITEELKQADQDIQLRNAA
jgi:transglutaminase-like putative cysteine protease